MRNDLFRKKTLEQINTEVAEGLVEGHARNMKKVLTVRDLTFMGIAAIVGAGIFSTIGKASFDGGPGIILLFLFIAVACGFSAVCYAEFASMVPVSGSAYTYSYVAFGELIAWIIGWDLLMEYAIGNIAVAISWSDYFCSLVNSIHIGNLHLHIPEFLSTDYWTAHEKATAGLKLLADHQVPDEGIKAGMLAWSDAPMVGGIRIICNLPAFLITFLITWIIYIGIRESRRSTNIMVILKIGIILLVMIAGCFYVNPVNWTPFLPHGITGVLLGTSAVFFSYIGFDAISTTAEECKNPQRDLPRAMFYSLIICTVMYVVIALVLTGMTSYANLGTKGDPLAEVFHNLHGKWTDYIAGVISISAVIAMASVLLVFQLGQPRIWMSMSRDGLLPPIFARMHPKYKTPSFSTIVTGLLVGVPALFMNLTVVVDLTSIGTLFAFVLVCGGILKLQNDPYRLQSKFKTPYLNGKYIVPVLFVLYLTGVGFLMMNATGRMILAETKDKTEYTWQDTIRIGWKQFDFKHFQAMMTGNILGILFGVTFFITAVLSFIKNYSIIPVLGFLCCTYLLSESGNTNWERLAFWCFSREA